MHPAATREQGFLAIWCWSGWHTRRSRTILKRDERCGPVLPAYTSSNIGDNALVALSV